MNWKRFFLPSGMPLRGPSPILPQGVTRGEPGWRSAPAGGFAYFDGPSSGAPRTPEEKARDFAREEKWLRAAGEIRSPINGGCAAASHDNRVWTSTSERCPNCGAASFAIEAGLRRCILVLCGTEFMIER